MIIYLKSGQTIDMGDVTTIMNEDNDRFKPLKYANDGDPIADWLYANEDSAIRFYNKTGEALELKTTEIVGIREDVK